MLVDLTNVETNTYLTSEGTHTLKVINVKEDWTQNNNQVLKVTMKTASDEIFEDDFVLTEKALWKLKLFTKALKMPNVVDTNMMINRYVVGEFALEDYVKKDGTTAKALKAKKWMPSKLTNTLEEMPQQQQSYSQLQQNDNSQPSSYGQENGQKQSYTPAPIPENAIPEIDEDEIPF